MSSSKPISKVDIELMTNEEKEEAIETISKAVSDVKNQTVNRYQKIVAADILRLMIGVKTTFEAEHLKLRLEESMK